MADQTVVFSDRPVLYFDGVCNLCASSVQFIIKRDKKKQFLFCPLQSDAGKLAKEQMGMKEIESVILFYKGNYYSKSSAALRICLLLGGMWQLLYAFIIVPGFIRNLLYDLVAMNRYKWFGKKDACMIPTPELLSRFIK